MERLYIFGDFIILEYLNLEEQICDVRMDHEN